MKRIVWDWNGTLFDDVELSFSVINRLLQKYHLEQLENIEKYQSVFEFPIENYYRKMGFDLEKIDFSVLAQQYMDDYQPKSKNCSLRKEALEALAYCKEKEIGQCVLSASKKINLLEQIDRLGISDYFDGIFGMDNIEASGKLECAKQLKTKYKGDTITIIGDSFHDYQLAQELGFDCILVTGGHQDIRKAPTICDDVLESVKSVYENN